MSLPQHAGASYQHAPGAPDSLAPGLLSGASAAAAPAGLGTLPAPTCSKPSAGALAAPGAPVGRGGACGAGSQRRLRAPWRPRRRAGHGALAISRLLPAAEATTAVDEDMRGRRRLCWVLQWCRAAHLLM